MAKKAYKEEKSETKAPAGAPIQSQVPNLPPEVQEKLQQMKTKIDKFTKEILEKFDKYIIGVSLLPPPRPEMMPPGAPPLTPEELKKIHVLVLVDDTDSQKMSKQELRDKLTTIIEQTAKSVDPDVTPQIVLLTELWQNCYDGKNELLQLIALGAQIHDTGMLSAIKIAEVHKQMVLKKFEKYIVSYVLAGSVVRGTAKPDSDIDVFVVIDDTDVKKMSRAELKDKLRGIIASMGFEAGEMTGIRNKINIQTYILTEFWDALREANPVMFTFLRDGVPFYDRGTFMPWKQLLKMGKIKPSPEAIDMYMSAGEQSLERVRFKIKEMAVEDFFWAIHTPTQAALMLYGIPPPAPKETVDVLREIFVKKEGLMTEDDVKMIEKIIKARKDLEHGVKKEVTGKELDELMKTSEKYFARLKRLFTQIEQVKEQEQMVNLYDTVITVIRDVLKQEGVEAVDEAELTEVFEKKLISTGKVPAKFVRTLHNFLDAKKKFDTGKLSKSEIEDIRKDSGEFIKHMVEFMQRKRFYELERAKIRVRYGDRFGEIIVLGNTAFIVKDVTNRQYLKATMDRDGRLSQPTEATPEEMEQALAKLAVPLKVFVREATFESLKQLFGRDVEILMG